MNPSNRGEDWEIYNCHIHTFTMKHSPESFHLWIFSDPKLGRINARKILWNLCLIGGYFGLLFLLSTAATLLSGRPDRLSQLGYSFLLLLQALLVTPLILLIGVLLALGALLVYQAILNLLLKLRSMSQPVQADSTLMKMKKSADRQQKKIVRSKLLYEVLVRIKPGSNDIFERTARFLKIAEQPTQEEVFLQVQRQYPNDEKVKTRFVVLPMDMTFMKLGTVSASIELQHEELLSLAECYKPQIIPFYAADPRHPDIVDRVKNNLVRGKFEGIKIYPSLGYPPDDDRLMEIYQLCIEGDFPVVTHCSPGGIWQYGLSKETRRAYSEPLYYKERILDRPGYSKLKLNLAHFGGVEEWNKHLQGRNHDEKEQAWVKTICDMIVCGDYPNLYTDISYTAFTPKQEGLIIDLIDYLKVLLTHPSIRKRVLFGSDYYMVERESVSEKEASILLRSRLGEKLYKQIAHTNPREFLCIRD
ncbi:MAG TPA: amidohydrolase family protein [Anaerolineales bacterium]|nr:amidohydrolase family protein [Anaerolineales bacterium]